MGLTVTDVGSEEGKQTKLELKKHAATIHCSNTLSLLQRKISNALLYHAYKELMDKEEHEISIKQLCRLIAYHGHNYAAIKDALKGLLSTVIEWNVVSDTVGKEDWTASSMLASVALRGPACYYAYSPRMKQLLHSPSMFGKINLFIQSHFKSSYGLALYENCIRYRGLGFTKWFEMDLFRKLMGVPTDIYTVFRDFKRRVLDKSIEEVNTYSDMIVEPEIIREGRQVVKIRFTLKERPKKTRLGNQALSVEDALRDNLMQHYGLTDDQIQQIIFEFGESAILEKMTLIETSKNYQEGKVQNLSAYLLSALKNDYQAPQSSRHKKQEKIQQDIFQADQLRSLRIEVQKIRDVYTTYREQTIDHAINTLETADYERLMQDFNEEASVSIRTILKLQRGKYTAETVLQSPQIKALLRQFALQEIAALRDELMSLQQYIDLLPVPHQKAWAELMLRDPNDELLRTEY